MCPGQCERLPGDDIFIYFTPDVFCWHDIEDDAKVDHGVSP